METISTKLHTPRCATEEYWNVNGQQLVRLKFAAQLELELIAATLPKVWLDSPNDSGYWWFSQKSEEFESEYSEPLHVMVGYSGAENNYFVTRGPWGCSRPQEINDMPGKWLKVEIPEPPSI